MILFAFSFISSIFVFIMGIVVISLQLIRGSDSSTVKRWIYIFVGILIVLVILMFYSRSSTQRDTSLPRETEQKTSNTVNVEQKTSNTVNEEIKPVENTSQTNSSAGVQQGITDMNKMMEDMNAMNNAMSSYNSNASI